MGVDLGVQERQLHRSCMSQFHSCSSPLPLGQDIASFLLYPTPHTPPALGHLCPEFSSCPAWTQIPAADVLSGQEQGADGGLLTVIIFK